MISLAPLTDDTRTHCYDRLTVDEIDGVGRARDVQLTGTTIARQEQLIHLDAVFPDYTNGIYETPFLDLSEMERKVLKMYMSMHEIPVPPPHAKYDYEKYCFAYQCIRYKVSKFGSGRKTDISTFLYWRFDNPMYRDIAVTLFSHLPYTLELCNDTEIFTLIECHMNSDMNTAAYKLKHTILQGQLSERYNMLKNSNKWEALRKLYRIPGIVRGYLPIANASPHPLESVILNLSQYDPAELIKQFGIILPPNADEYVYLRDNLADYGPIFTRIPTAIYPKLNILTPAERKSFLEQCTDRELLNHYGIKTTGTARLQNIDQLMYLAVNKSFMLLHHRNNAVNDETTMLTMVTDYTIFMIAYGYLESYRVYELSELIQAFTEYRIDNGKRYVFKRPEDPRTYFRIEDMKTLRGLLEGYTTASFKNDVMDLLLIINVGMADLEANCLPSDDEVYKHFCDLSPIMVGLWKKFLYHTLDTGFYMRRWRGPGTPYPILDAETRRSTEDETNDIVAKRMIESEAILQELTLSTPKLLEKLLSCSYKNGVITSNDMFFKVLWKKLYRGKMCIRQGSVPLIHSCHHYLLLLGASLPDVDVKALQEIS